MKRFEQMKENIFVSIRIPHFLAVRFCHVFIPQSMRNDLQCRQIFAQLR